MKDFLRFIGISLLAVGAVILLVIMVRSEFTQDDDDEYIDYEIVAEEKYEEGYSEGFTEGYYVGYDEAYEKAFNNAYYEAYEKTNDKYITHIKDIVREAEHYASSKTTWHPEEAIGILEECRNGSNEYTEEEYNQAVGCLIRFYDYFLGEHFEY